MSKQSTIWQQAVAKLPWGHNLILLRVPDMRERQFHAINALP